jgi:hypothetical protein
MTLLHIPLMQRFLNIRVKVTKIATIQTLSVDAVQKLQQCDGERGLSA